MYAAVEATKGTKPGKLVICAPPPHMSPDADVSCTPSGVHWAFSKSCSETPKGLYYPMWPCSPLNAVKVDAANAQTRREEDKVKVDNYIRQGVGFDVVNQTIEREITKSHEIAKYDNLNSFLSCCVCPCGLAFLLATTPLFCVFGKALPMDVRRPWQEGSFRIDVSGNGPYIS